MNWEINVPGAEEAAYALRQALPGKVVLPLDAAYAGARQIWNGAVRCSPAAIVRCVTTGDVRVTIAIARRHGAKLSVRGGGHDWVGRSLCEDGVVIDLSAMRQVSVNAERRIATVAGGATARELIAAAAPHGLVAVTGSCGDVGITGLTLGGGYGLLSPRHGLAADNLLRAEVVLADGRIIVADDQEHPDLYWALRGGGGNFGVVTRMQIALHPQRDVLGGLILFPWSEAEAVLRGYADIMALAPDDFGALAGLIPTPDGQPAAFLAPVWTGEVEKGADAIAALERLGQPLCVNIAPMSYANLLAMFDAHAMDGCHYTIRTRWLPALTPQVISTLLAAEEARTSPLSIIVLHGLHGAATRIHPTSTAFHLRRDHFLVEAISAWNWDNDEQRAEHRAWARTLSDELARNALPGGYANLLGPDDTDQIASAFGENTDRLLAVKHKFDPDGVFTAIPLPL